MIYLLFVALNQHFIGYIGLPWCSVDLSIQPDLLPLQTLTFYVTSCLSNCCYCCWSFAEDSLNHFQPWQTAVFSQSLKQTSN